MEQGSFSDTGLYNAHSRAVAGRCTTPYSIAEGTGRGSIRSIGCHSGVSIYAHSMCFRRDVSFSGEGRENSLLFGFCLGDGVEWSSSKTNASIGRGDYYIQSGATSDEIEYLAGARYEFLCISLSRNAIESLFGDETEKIDSALPRRRPCLQGETPALVKTLLHQMELEPCERPLSNIYSYGKACEIVAVTMSECLSPSRTATPIKRTDRMAIAAARRILEDRYSDPPTYPELAREVCLSESKLSRGFREMYGTTIHSYVVAVRLEAAWRMMEKGGLGVSEIACHVGYSNPSHFSEAFKRRFGILPKEALAARPAGKPTGFGRNDTGFGLQ